MLRNWAFLMLILKTDITKRQYEKNVWNTYSWDIFCIKDLYSNMKVTLYNLIDMTFFIYQTLSRIDTEMAD